MNAGLLPADGQDENPVVYEFLEVPWESRNGRLVVKGSDEEFVPDETGGPLSKYQALFDRRHAFDGLRFTFLTRVCRHDMSSLIGDVLVSDANIHEESLQVFIEFMESYSSAFEAEVELAESPPNFAAEAWPLWVDCLCDTDGHYYLSCNELLLACELSHTDVVIFATRSEHASYLGSVTGFRNETPVLVALHGVDAGARVRSHFQRLVLMSHLLEVRRRITEDERIEAASHRERDRMSAEDTASLMFIGWVRREQKAMAESDFDASPPQPIPTNDVFDQSRLGLPRSVETGAAQSENAVPQSGVAGPPRAAGGEIPISNRCPRCDRVGHTSDACPFYKGGCENHPDASWGDTTPHLQQTQIFITSGGELSLIHI